MEENKIIKYEQGHLQRLSLAIAVTNKLLSEKKQPLRILHLDDHDLFLNATKGLILKNWPDTLITNIKNGNDALNYVISCLNDKHSIDIIITDIVHTGLNGIEYVQKVREVEKPFGSKIPIIVYSFHYDTASVIESIKGLVDKFLPKNASGETILNTIKSLVK